MKKRVFIVSGVVMALLLLLAATLVTGINVVRAIGPASQALAPALRAQAAAATAAPADKGVVIVAVAADSPAATTGIKRGDILLQVDDTAVNTPLDLVNALSTHKSGDSVKLTITHGDSQNTLTATLGDQNGLAYLGVEPGVAFPMMGLLRKGEFFSNTVPVSVTGNIIVEVIAGSPAEKAGLKKGDLVTAVNGEKLGPGKTLADVVGTHKPGDSVTLDVEQSGHASHPVQVTLGEDPNKKGAPYMGVRFTVQVEGYRAGPRNGFRVAPPQAGVSQGVVVRSVTDATPAKTAGLQVGDIITAIDGKTLDTPQALVDAIAAHKVGDQVKLSVQHVNAAASTDITVTLGDNPDKKGSPYLGVSVGGGFFREPGGMPGYGGPGRQQPGIQVPRQTQPQQSAPGSTL